MPEPLTRCPWLSLPPFELHDLAGQCIVALITVVSHSVLLSLVVDCLIIRLQPNGMFERCVQVLRPPVANFEFQAAIRQRLNEMILGYLLTE